MLKAMSCKLGTQPALLILRYNYKITVGKVMLVRKTPHGSKFFRIRVTSLGPDSYFFCEYA